MVKLSTFCNPALLYYPQTVLDLTFQNTWKQQSSWKFSTQIIFLDELVKSQQKYNKPHIYHLPHLVIPL